MEKTPVSSYVALIIGVISVSTAAVLVKLASEAPASIIATYRLLFAVLFMSPYVFIKNRKEFKQITKHDWLLSALAGIFLAFHFILWFESLNYTSVASSVVLVTLQPLFAFLGTYLFYKERFTTSAFLSMVLAIIGSIIISWGDFRISGIALFGDILALLGAVMVTGYFLFGQSVRKRLSLMTYTYVVYGISTLTLIIYNLILHKPFFGYSLNTWYIFIALAIIPTFFGHTLFNWALKWHSTTTISMGILFEPIGASILAYFLLHEIIKKSQFIGGSVVILGLSLFLFSTSKSRKKQRLKEEKF